MCGIAGLICFSASIDARQIFDMTSLLRHRGPNDEGYLSLNFNPEVTVSHHYARADLAPAGAALFDRQHTASAQGFFGHTRLSIIDTSTLGHQPMFGHGRWIVFNGEIYNYLELASELRNNGYTFQSCSDTEVILAAFDFWGQNCVQRFNGDWAFCIFDSKTQQIFLSRDRYGIKPLYFYWDKQYFAFASEIKSLLALPFVNGEVCRQRIVEDLLFSTLDYDQHTLYPDIKQLLPATNFSLDLRSQAIAQQSYYRVNRSNQLGSFCSQAASRHITETRDLLVDAVRLRLRADVPIGACLSGGLDSSALVAIMQQLRQEAHAPGLEHTFTVSFPGTKIDESHYAELVSSHCRTQHHVVLISEQDFTRSLISMLELHDEPFGGASTYAQHAVYSEASKFVTVVLDGQGADEVFAGYRNLRIAYLASLAKSGRILSLFSECAGVMLQQRSVSRIFAELKSLPFFLLPLGIRLRVFERLHRALSSEFLNLTQGQKALFRELFELRFCSDFNQLLANYMLRSSLPHLLKYADRNSMSHAVEARMPFTDYRLVDHLFSLPACYKVHNGWTKWLLRKAVEDLLPAKIVWRTDKLGFAAPQWVTKDQLYSRSTKTAKVSSGATVIC